MTNRWRRGALALALLLGAVLVLALAAAAAGASIDASPWRDMAARHASVALGRPVALDGALRLTLGRRLVLHIADARVLSPAGFEANELASLGKAAVAFDLLDLLRGLARPRSIEASDLSVHLERGADGRGNWTPQTPGAPGTSATDLDIPDVRIERARVQYHDVRAGTRRVLELTTLSATAPTNEGLRVALQGRIDASPLVKVQLEGGPLAALQTGDAPWPFKLEATSGADRLQAKGQLDTRQGEARFSFEAVLDDPAPFASVVGLTLPPLGATSLRGEAVMSADSIDLAGLRGRLAGSELAGAIKLEWAATRPRLEGALHFALLHLGPWLGPRAAGPGSAPETAATGWRVVALRQLMPLDIELDLRVDRSAGLPLEVRDATLTVRGDAAGLRAPVSANVEGVAVTGEVRLDTAAKTPGLSLQIATRDQPLATFASGLGFERDIDGRLGRLDLKISGHGETLADWAQTASTSLAVNDLVATLRSGPTGKPLPIRLGSLTLRASHDEGLRGQGRALLAGEPVAIAIKGGRLAELVRGAALPVELEATAAPARLRISTELGATPDGLPSALRFAFDARRAGALAAWLPVAPDSVLPLALRGELRLTEAAWHLEQIAIKLGRSDLRLAASGPRGENTALTSVRVHSRLLDVPELLALRAAPPQSERATVPSFPAAAARLDAQFALQEVTLGRTTLRDVRADAQIREGHLLPAAFGGRVGSTNFEGVAELDLRSEPRARLELAAREVDLGALLRELRLANPGVTGRASSLQIGARARGRTWHELAVGTEIMARLSGGAIAVRAGSQEERAEITLRTATVEIPAGGRLGVRLDGTVNGTSVQLDLQGATLAQWLGDSDRLPLALSARAPGTHLTIDGTLGLPLGSSADLQLKASGGQLASLGGLSPLELPPWGPWSVEGPLRATHAGIDLPGLEVRVGNSQLRADGELDLRGERPQLDLRLVSSRLALDDFPLPRRDPRPARSAIGTARDVTRRTGELLVSRWLRGFDAKLEVQAGEVIGTDGLVGEARLRARLQQGRLDVGPAVLTLPGGNLRVSMSSELKDSGLDFALAADLDRFDYGFIAAEKGGGDQWHGLVSMKLQLHGSAPSLDEIPLHARGQADLAVWPNDLRTGQFDLWTVNLLLAVTNVFTHLFMPQTPPRMNCVIGRFNFNDGKITEDQLIIDTNAVRVRGAGEVDLASEKLDFVFRPRAKGFAMFRLQQPLRVTGTISDQRIGTDPRDTPEAVLRLIASPVLWPLERLTLGPLPRDGQDVCTDPLRPVAP